MQSALYQHDERFRISAAVPRFVPMSTLVAIFADSFKMIAVVLFAALTTLVLGL